MNNRCIYCGQGNVDGGHNATGQFICIDCIAFDDMANAEIVEMAPLNPVCGTYITYPSECYDVSKYKRTHNSPKAGAV